MCPEASRISEVRLEWVCVFSKEEFLTCSQCIAGSFCYFRKAELVLGLFPSGNEAVTASNKTAPGEKQSSAAGDKEELTKDEILQKNREEFFKRHMKAGEKSRWVARAWPGCGESTRAAAQLLLVCAERRLCHSSVMPELLFPSLPLELSDCAQSTVWCSKLRPHVGSRFLLWGGAFPTVSKG